TRRSSDLDRYTLYDGCGRRAPKARRYAARGRVHPFRAGPIMTQRILMIEDDQRLASMVGAYLARNGYAFDHAATGAAGLAALQGGAGEPFAAILLDLMLPDGDGLDICRRIRAAAPPRDSIPILMLTAKGDPF